MPDPSKLPKKAEKLAQQALTSQAALDPAAESPRLASAGIPQSLQRILERARDLGVPDLAEQHDHYLYGTLKL